MKNILKFIIFLFLLQSCTSNDNSNNSVLEGKLKKIVISDNGNTYVQNFEYDTNGKLIQYTSDNLVHTYSRNSNGKITNDNFSDGTDVIYNITYTLDTNGNYFSSEKNENGSITQTYYLYTNNKIIQTNSSDGTSKYTYDNNGNIIKIEKLYNNQWNTSAILSYDNFVTCIQVDEIFLFGGCGINNPTSIINYDLMGNFTSSFNYNYTYNSSNKPLSATETINYSNNQSQVRTRNYYYY